MSFFISLLGILAFSDKGECIIEVDTGVFMLVTKEWGFDGNWAKALATLVVEAACQGSKLTGKGGSHFISKVLAAVAILGVGIKDAPEESIVADGIENALLAGGGVAYRIVEMIGGELLLLVVEFINTSSLLLLSLWFIVIQFLLVGSDQSS